MDDLRSDQHITLHDGRQLGFAAYGDPDGTALMLFHGTPGSRYLAQLDKTPWIHRHRIRLIVPERPGYGLSDPAPGRRERRRGELAAALP